MSFYNICHDKGVHYDIVCSASIHRCRVCGSVWECVIPPWPEEGGKYESPYWVERWTLGKFFGKLFGRWS